MALDWTPVLASLASVLAGGLAAGARKIYDDNKRELRAAQEQNRQLNQEFRTDLIPVLSQMARALDVVAQGQERIWQAAEHVDEQIDDRHGLLTAALERQTQINDQLQVIRPKIDRIEELLDAQTSEESARQGGRERQHDSSRPDSRG